MDTSSDILESELGNLSNGKSRPRLDAYDAATLYATDSDWRDVFEEAVKAAKDEKAQALQQVIAKAQEELAALGAPVPAKTTAPKAKPAIAPQGGKDLRALDLLKTAGDWVSARKLTAELGVKAGTVLDPLVESGKVKRKGKRGGVAYRLA